MLTNRCETCGKEYWIYPSEVGRSRFCSRQCHNMANARQQTERATETRICPVCGCQFETTNHHGGRKACSPACANTLRGAADRRPDGKEERRCKVCGETFRVFPSRPTEYCSPECGAIGKVRKQTGKVRTSIVVPCSYCGKPIRKFKSRVRHYGRQFCDNACYHAWDAQYKGSEEMRGIMAERTAQRVANGEFGSPSGVERTVAAWFTKCGLTFEAQVRLGRHRVVDFKVGDTYVEVHGCYWHGCPTHFPEPTVRQRRRIGLDASLVTYCRRRNIPLLVIWEHDVRARDFRALAPLLK